MELSQLKTFTAVAKTLNFTSAAKELGLTQPAVSHQIKSLENALGEILFVRGGPKVSLTSEGKLVLEYAKKMLGQVEKMREDISETGASESGTVRLTAITRSMDNPFLELRNSWREINRDIELTFDAAMLSESVIEKVRNNEADIGFSTLTDDFDDLVSIPWGSFDLDLVCGRDHPLARLNSVGLEELKTQKWILFEQGSWLRRETDRIFSRYGFTPEDVYLTNDGSVAGSLIHDCFGISLMPKWGIAKELISGNLKVVEVDNVEMQIPVRILARDSGRSKIVNTFLGFLVETKLQRLLPVTFETLKAP